MTRNEILAACNELGECIEGHRMKPKDKALAFTLLVEALLCLRAIADNTAPAKIEDQ